MESIDITDAAFSLGIPPIVDDIRYASINGGDVSEDYTLFIYISAAILVSFIGIIYFKFYKNKKIFKNEDLDEQQGELDCQGGFCNMGQNMV
jgi:hypothetical protein